MIESWANIYHASFPFRFPLACWRPFDGSLKYVAVTWMANKLCGFLEYVKHVFARCSDTPIYQVIQMQSCLYCVQLSTFVTRGHRLAFYPQGNYYRQGQSWFMSCFRSCSTYCLANIVQEHRTLGKESDGIIKGDLYIFECHNSQNCNSKSLFDKAGDWESVLNENKN